MGLLRLISTLEIGLFVGASELDVLADRSDYTTHLPHKLFAISNGRVAVQL